MALIKPTAKGKLQGYSHGMSKSQPMGTVAGIARSRDEQFNLLLELRNIVSNSCRQCSNYNIVLNS